MRTIRPDVVIPVRKGDYNEELRYALRSLAVNVPHDRVWIVGHKPAFLRDRGLGNRQGIYYYPRPQKESKYRNATLSLVEVARELGASMSSPFLLSNDDFYVMQPIQGPFPVLHMGKVEEVISWYSKMHHRGAYWRGMVSTFERMKELGIRDPYSYELHIPMPIYREPLLEAWEKGKDLDVLHIRTLYGNIAQLGGEHMEDVKVYRGRTTGYTDWPFLSSNDDMTLTPLRRLLRERFPNPSPYELSHG